MTEPRVRELFDGSRHDFRDRGRARPVRTHVWEPADGGDGAPPVVLISHGTGGAARQMGWLAQPLAAAGFLAVSVDHHGNSFADAHLPQGFAFLWERPRDMTFVLDVLAAERAVGPVGAAGFSAGGYTSAALVGARVDADAVRAVLAGRVPGPPVPEFPGLVDALRERVPEAELERALAQAGGDYADDRVRAAFLVCPAVGALVTTGSLNAVGRPVAIRWGDADTIAPPERDALRYLDAIPTATGRSAGEDVEHYDFLGDNAAAGAGTRRRVAAEAVAFFRHHLAAGTAGK